LIKIITITTGVFALIGIVLIVVFKWFNIYNGIFAKPNKPIAAEQFCKNAMWLARKFPPLGQDGNRLKEVRSAINVFPE
jgi:hypothetical protein